MNQHCPHCNQIIFRAGQLDEQAFGPGKSDPQIYQTGADLYANCPSCGQPVRMEASTGETGPAYVVSHNLK